MHQVLLVQEIVRMVMQNICNDESKRTKALFNAALTCSSFLEPALDALWHDMQSILPLFQLISNFKLQHAVIWGSIPDTQLATFNKYASRVRSYHWQDTNDKVDISTYIYILRACGRSYIFPNLVDLNISSTLEGECTSKVMFLMPPCLRKFCLFVYSTHPVSIILNSLQIAAPNISHLTLACTLDDHCISALCSLSQLQEIVLSDSGEESAVLNLSFILRLSCKKVLQNLTLNGMDMRMVWSADNLDFGAVEFPLLKNIYFRPSFSMGPIAELFRYVTVPSLEGLMTSFGPSPSGLVEAGEAQYWHQFFDRIGNATSNHFKKLRIMVDLFFPPEKTCRQWGLVGLRVSDLPNFDNLSLETLIIGLPILGSLDRNGLTKIINSWPNLSNLELKSYRPSELNFTALLDIAIGLPCLEDLDIPLDIHGPLSLEGIPLLAHNLQRIQINTLADLKPDNFDLLVRCIDRIFPYLKKCEFYTSIHYDVWEDTSSLLGMMQNARRDEFERAALGITGV